MQLTVKGPDGVSIWTHFLMQDAEVTVRPLNGGAAGTDIPLLRGVSDAFRWTVPDDCTSFDFTVRVTHSHNGNLYSLLRIVQRFDVVRSGAEVTSLTATQWQKGPPDRQASLTKIRPILHPLLTMDGVTVRVEARFLDVTGLFDDLHGDTPWYSALALLKQTERTIKVMASLTGAPLVWYVVIPQSARAEKEIRPILLYYPADYGGISYAQDKFEGLASPNHDTSIGSIQSGGETLLMFLTQPISDADYTKRLPAFLRLTKRHAKRPGNPLPPLHHFRNVLAYKRSGGTLVPEYWHVPFGFEAALASRKQVLVIPQMNGGEGGIAIKPGLQELLGNLMMIAYTQDDYMNYDNPTVGDAVLTCYSESGGNVFTAAANNDRIRAIVCFEPQYMNAHLKWTDNAGHPHEENKSLKLGKVVIPRMLQEGRKVAIIGRHRGGWEKKYLPDSVSPSQLIILPDDAHESILDYPSANAPYDPSRWPLLARRYSRLLKPDGDAVISAIIASSSSGDDASRVEESAIRDIIGSLRRRGLSDEQLIKNVFVPAHNVDGPGGFFTHNFIVSAGQELKADSATIYGFFEKALELVG